MSTLSRICLLLATGFLILPATGEEFFDGSRVLLADNDVVKEQLLKPMTPKMDMSKPKPKHVLKARVEHRDTFEGAKGKWIGATKQIFEYDMPIRTSKVCNFTGVPACVRSARGNNRGVLIKGIADGYAWQIGLEEGDVIFSLNDHVMQSSADVDRFLCNAEDGQIRLLFARPTLDGMQVYNARKPFQASIARLSGAANDIEITKKDKDKPKGKDPCACSAKASITTFEDFVVELINADRRAASLPSLYKDGMLGRIAHDKATIQAAGNETAVANPDSLFPIAKNSGEKGAKTSVGEAMAFENCHDSPQATVTRCHKKINTNIMLNPAYLRVGVGVGLDENNRVFIVEEFN